MVHCPTQVELEHFLDGTCNPEEGRHIETHQEACPDCQGWLNDARADDALFGDVQRLVRRPAGILSDTALSTVPSSISRYKILGRLGAGGMGVVYEAEQKNPRRRVALKLLKPGFVTPRALARFEHEARVLGRLDHPGIARILEADTVEVHGERQPFFAMELVEGRPLNEVASELELDERLALFLQICAAVQHAHQKGVIHRDLKPSNILVDPNGLARVLDFGVARTIDDDEMRTTLRSRAGEILGTLPYMSPEQISGRPEEIDTRTDVYALGVLLYELCAGRTPFSLTDASLPEAARIITEERPPPLASGDLGTIAAKALEKEKERRYPSAAALADDVHRFLQHRPIEARPPSAIYQFRKYARRNRAVVAALGLAILLLVGGIVATSVQVVRARDAEELATRNAEYALAEAATEQAANQFLFELLGNDGDTRPEDYTVLAALRRAELRVEARELADPKVEATIRIALGSTQHRFDDFEPAEANLERAVELREQAYGPAHPRTAGALNSLAVLRVKQGRPEAAQALYHRALDAYRRSGKGESPEAGTTLGNIGFVHLRRREYDLALPWMLAGTEIHRRHLAEYPDHVANDLSMLSRVYRGLRLFDNAEECLREAVSVYDSEHLRRSLGEADARHDLAEFLRSRDVDAAITEYREALAIRVEGHMSRKDRAFVRNVERLAALFDDLGLTDEARAVRAELRSPF